MVPVGAAMSFEYLAKACNLNELDIHRLLRFAMASQRVFQEKPPDFVSHTVASRKLAKNPQAMMGIVLMFDEWIQAFAHVRIT